MDEYEDEDVVFEGSTLHQHLMDTGYTDFEPSSLSHPSSIPETPQPNYNASKKTIVGQLKEKCADLYATVSRGWLGDGMVVVDGVSDAIVVSGLVGEEDWLLLDHFLPQVHRLPLTPPDQQDTLGTTQTLFTPINMLSLLVSSVVFCVVVMVVKEEAWSYLPIIILLLLPPALLLMIQACALRKSYRLVVQLKEMIVLLRELSQISSKALRLLQEVDLIAKGFVLAQGSINNKFSMECESPQTSSLRGALAKTLQTVSPVILHFHEFLCPYTHQYPCIKDIFEYTPNVPDGCTATEYLYFLKKWVAMTKIQLSTVMTELLLCVHQRLGLEKLYSSYNQIITQDQIALINTEIKMLINHYEFTKSYWFENSKKEKDHKSIEENKKNVYIALHSLNLHMQAALYRVHTLEAEFENENENSGPGNSEDDHDTEKGTRGSSFKLDGGLGDKLKTSSPNNGLGNSEDVDSKRTITFKYVQDQLSVVRRELESCRGCLEEAEARVDRKYGVGGSLPKLEHLDPREEPVDISSSSSQKVIILSALEAPIIEDEVFEAYIDHEYSERSGDDYDDFWNADVRRERQILRQQKEQGRRVLSELRPILVNRRKMWEQREEVALNRTTLPHKAKSPAKNTVQLEDQHKVEEKSCVSAVSNQPTGHRGVEKCDCLDNDADSDEERLEVYRKLRKELDEDENRRRREEEEEKEVNKSGDRKFRKELDTNRRRREEETKELNEDENTNQREEKEEEEEVDSDEERLEVYRKLRKELDEDESRRRKEDDDEPRIGFSLADLKPFKSVYKSKSDSASSECNLQDTTPALTHTTSLSLTHSHTQPSSECNKHDNLPKSLNYNEPNLSPERLSNSRNQCHDIDVHNIPDNTGRPTNTNKCPGKLNSNDLASNFNRFHTVAESGLVLESESDDVKNGKGRDGNIDTKEIITLETFDTHVNLGNLAGRREETNEKLETVDSDGKLSQGDISINTTKRNEKDVSINTTKGKQDENYPKEDETYESERREIGVETISINTTKSKHDEFYPREDETYESERREIGAETMSINTTKSKQDEIYPREDETYESERREIGVKTINKARNTQDNEIYPREDETYEANDNSDESREIDWGIIQAPSTLEERLTLYSGGGGVGFHAQIAAQARAASKLFTLASAGTEETFDGVGEGEESSDDSLDSDDEKQ